MNWTIKYLRSAKHGLKGIYSKDKLRLKESIETLAKKADPQDVGEKLQGKYFRDYYRIRVGKYRVVYRTENDELLLIIFRVGHRSEVYKN